MEEKEMTAVDAAVAAARRAIKDAILSGELAAEYSPCAIGEAHTRIAVKICGRIYEMWLGDSYLISPSEMLKDAFSDLDDFEALRKMAAEHVAPPSKETMERIRKVHESITEMMNTALGGLGDLCEEKERIRKGGDL